MANTTYFGWETPDDTDLVKDGAAAIRTLGQAIDTSMQDLEGGTTGQILSKNSNTDMDFVWITNDVGDITEVVASTPLTGGGSSGSVTVGIQDGTTAQKGAVQLEDSTSSTSTTKASTPNSVKSAYDLANAAIPKSLVDAAGDLIYATANDTPARLAIGTAGQVLKVNSGATAPEWGAAGGASGLTLIKRASFSNVAGTTTTFDSVFDSTYKAYLVIIEHIFGATSTNDLQLQMLFSGTTRTSGYYGGTGIATYLGTNTAVANNNAAHFILSQDIGVSQNLGSAGQLQFNNVGNASNIANWNGLIANNSNSESAFVGGSVSDATTYTGFLLKASSGNVTGVVAVYGLAAA